MSSAGVGLGGGTHASSLPRPPPARPPTRCGARAAARGPPWPCGGEAQRPAHRFGRQAAWL